MKTKTVKILNTKFTIGTRKRVHERRYGVSRGETFVFNIHMGKLSVYFTSPVIAKRKFGGTKDIVRG